MTDKNQNLDMVKMMLKNVTAGIEKETDEERAQRLKEISERNDISTEQVYAIDEVLKSMAYHIRNERDVQDKKVIGEFIENDAIIDKASNVVVSDPESLALTIRYMNEVMEQENVYQDLNIPEADNVDQLIDTE